MQNKAINLNSLRGALAGNLLRLLACLIVLGSSSALEGQTEQQTVQRSVFLQQGSLPVQTVPIPDHLWQQAMAYGQPLNYQPQLEFADSEAVAPVAVEGEVVEESFDGVVSEDTLDPYGLVRVWANGVPPRLITVQRYSDHYWQFNVDLLSLERDSVINESRLWLGGSRPSGGARISAKADLFYSFDLELAWLGGLFWSNTSSEINWGPRFNTNYNITKISSNFNAFEINTRWRWVETTRPWTGAWILGVRYVRFADHAIINDPISNSFPYSYAETDIVNNLVGFQLGGELFWSVWRGLMVGGDLKAGVYGNNAKRETIAVERGDGTKSFDNEIVNQTTSFLGEANVMVNAHLGHNWYIRGGYTGLVLQGVSLGSDALLVDPITGTLPIGGRMIAHGFYGGLEWQY
jgi:hypothetical protein